MCVEEEGDGKAIRGGVTSITHQLIDHAPPSLFISLCRALREIFFSLALLLSWCLHFHLSPLHPSVLSLLRMDECECAARNLVHPSLLHWQGWPLSSSMSDATRRLHSGFIQEGWSGCWLQSSESFCLSEKQTLNLTSSHCTGSKTGQDMNFCCLSLLSVSENTTLSWKIFIRCQNPQL